MEENKTQLPSTPDVTPIPEPIQPLIQPPTQPIPIPEPPDYKMSQKLLIPSIVLLIVAVILVSIKLILQNKPTMTPEPTPTPLASPKPTAEASDPTANWKTYTNNALGVSFKHPGDWVITERDTDVVLLKDPDIRTIVGACPGYSFSVSKYDPYLNYSRFDKVIKSNLDGESTEIWTNNNLGCKEKFIFVNSLPSNTIKPKYIISFISKNSDGDILFDQIFSTFKFKTSENDKESSCVKEGAEWLAQFNECESPTLPESFCQKLGGRFYECESPCRHDPKIGFCMQSCMAVCKFN